MERNESAGLTAPVHGHIDGSVLAGNLAAESVTPGEVRELLRIARHELETEGVESTVNGLPARVTKDAIPVEVDGKTYLARVYMLNAVGEDDEDVLPGIGFDETPDVAIVTPNANALRFMRTWSNDKPAIIADSNDMSPEVDRPEHVEIVRNVLRGIATQIAERKQQEAQVSIDAKRERAESRRGTARAIGRGALKAVKWTVGSAAAAAAVAAAVYGIGKIDIKSFDDHHYKLDGGTELVLGESGHPEFSKDLYDSSSLNAEHMPGVYDDNHHDSGATSDSSDTLEASDTLREVTIYGSKGDYKCEEFPIEQVPLDTRLVVWTDAVDANGISRADEFTVKYEAKTGRVCWDGKEQDKHDDPRIVVALRPASESKPR